MIRISVNHYTPTQIKEILVPWAERNASKEYAYTWPFSDFTFSNEGDAIAFMLKFGGSRVESKIEKMLREIDEGK
jgi:hypothetical protein